jgi:hypothetical protein
VSTSTSHLPTCHYRPGPRSELGNLHLDVDPARFSYQYTSLHITARLLEREFSENNTTGATRSALHATFAKWENTRAPVGTYTGAECIILYSRRRRQRVNNQLVYYYRRRHYIPERLLYCPRARVVYYIYIYLYHIHVNAYSIIIIVKGR